mmetsp:Transcript_10294/g.22839  ORF Transcript_10294/g.22839 Transcript_10294/m.22839 type:complete len:241 (+) Transcript_10294:743-1465(+)
MMLSSSAHNFSSNPACLAAHLPMASFTTGSESSLLVMYISFQFERLVPRILQQRIILGNNVVMEKKKGATMKSAKFMESSSCLTVSRSQFIDTGKFSLFSLSPCRKNSSHTRSDHLRDTVQRLAGLEMSAVCRIDFITTRRSFSSIRVKGSEALRGGASVMFLLTTASNSALSTKWCIMSVFKTNAITFLRNPFLSVGVRPETMLHPVAAITSKALAQWWFSSTLMSLYRIARGVSALTW